MRSSQLLWNVNFLILKANNQARIGSRYFKEFPWGNNVNLIHTRRKSIQSCADLLWQGESSVVFSLRPIRLRVAEKFVTNKIFLFPRYFFHVLPMLSSKDFYVISLLFLFSSSITSSVVESHKCIDVSFISPTFWRLSWVNKNRKYWGRRRRCCCFFLQL